MRIRFYAIAILLLACAAMLVDLILGKLYIRYMILFSGALFLGGMAVGQRTEQQWMRRRAEQARLTRLGSRVKAGQEGAR